jgi:hypothetical protein
VSKDARTSRVATLPSVDLARAPELRHSRIPDGSPGPLTTLRNPKILHNFVAAAVFFFLGRSVYPAWIYCVTGWTKIRWLWLKNQEFPHSHF